MSSRWANHGGGRGRYPAWRTVAIAVLSAPGAVPGREASGLTVATLVREEHRCTDALHGTLGRLPERMTVRVFDANSTRPGSSGRWYRSSLPFGRPFALDDTEGALVGISVDTIGTAFAVTGSVMETAPYYGHSDCTAAVEASVETFHEIKTVQKTERYGTLRNFTRHRTGNLLSGVVQMACRYTADDGVTPLFGQCFGTYSFRNHNLTDHEYNSYLYSGPWP